MKTCWRPLRVLFFFPPRNCGAMINRPKADQDWHAAAVPVPHAGRRPGRRTGSPASRSGTRREPFNTPPWRSIRFRLALRAYAPWGVRVVSQTKSRKIPTRKKLPLFFASRHPLPPPPPPSAAGTRASTGTMGAAPAARQGGLRAASLPGGHATRHGAGAPPPQQQLQGEGEHVYAQSTSLRNGAGAGATDPAHNTYDRLSRGAYAGGLPCAVAVRRVVHCANVCVNVCAAGRPLRQLLRQFLRRLLYFLLLEDVRGVVMVDMPDDVAAVAPNVIGVMEAVGVCVIVLSLPSVCC